MPRPLASFPDGGKKKAHKPERSFVERLARQHEILNQLRRAKEPANISALARQFNVDRKTIRRDLCDLVQRGQLEGRFCHEAEDF